MSEAQQFQHAGCHVGEFKNAQSLLDCGRLEANQRSEARAIKMFYITKVDNDPTAKRNEGPHQFLYLTSGVTDQLAMALDCRHLIAVSILIFRLLKFTVERTISCHSSAVSSSESDERLERRVLHNNTIGQCQPGLQSQLSQSGDLHSLTALPRVRMKNFQFSVMLREADVIRDSPRERNSRTMRYKSLT
jgi:hypothetical protein